MGFLQGPAGTRGEEGEEGLPGERVNIYQPGLIDVFKHLNYFSEKAIFFLCSMCQNFWSVQEFRFQIFLRRVYFRTVYLLIQNLLFKIYFSHVSLLGKILRSVHLENEHSI